jgi:hypothetical protein
VSEPFDSCWERIERAATHRKTSIEIWNAFIEDHPYHFSLDPEGDGVFVLRVWQDRPTPPELSVIAGEWFYNLRCALDYAIWAAAVYENGSLPPPNEGVLQYPIYDSAAAWSKNLYRLKPLTQHQRDRLATMQPYSSEDPDANYLGWINRLARIDRHRRLSVVTAYMAEMSPVFQVPEGCTTALQFGNRVLVDGHADIARVTVSPWQEDWEIKANPRVGIDPEIADWAQSPFWQRWPYDDRLKMIEIFVMGEIACWEYEATGAGRKSSLLTDTFRAECDARRSSKEIVHHRPPKEWGPPMVGKPSTRDRFEGRDFPAHGSGPRVPGTTSKPEGEDGRSSQLRW